MQRRVLASPPLGSLAEKGKRVPTMQQAVRPVAKSKQALTQTQSLAFVRNTIRAAVRHRILHRAKFKSFAAIKMMKLLLHASKFDGSDSLRILSSNSTMYWCDSELAIAQVGEVAFLRGLFDDSCFGDKLAKMGGIRVHQLQRLSKEDIDEIAKDESQLGSISEKLGLSPEAIRLSMWLESGAFDALEKGYLRSLCIAVYQPAMQASGSKAHASTVQVEQLAEAELLEAYVFKFKYPSKG